MKIRLKIEQQLCSQKDYRGLVVYEFLRTKYQVSSTAMFGTTGYFIASGYPVRVLPKMLYKHPLRFN